MRTDLSQATFIIPIRIESPDRLRNVITTTAFLLENFDTNIIIQEVDKHSVFEKEEWYATHHTRLSGCKS